MKFINKVLFALGLLTSPVQAQIVGTLPYTITNGTVTDANKVMSDYNYIIAQVNANAATAGANSNITALTGLLVPIPAGEGGSQLYTAGASSGAANAQVVTSGLTPTGFVLAGKPVVCFVAGFTNTGALTLNVNSTGAVAVYKRLLTGLTPTTGNEVVAGQLTCAQYDGTYYELTYDNTLASGAAGARQTLTAAATTDLGTISSHNVYVSGSATVTSFGSSASVVGSVYFVTFSGGQTLTYNATSMILPGSVSYTTSANDSTIAIYLGSGSWQLVSYTPGGFPAFNLGKPFNVRQFTSGSGSYTPTVGTLYVRVKMVGAGGGGGMNSSGAGYLPVAGTASQMGNGTFNFIAPGGGGGTNVTTANAFNAGGTGGTSFTATVSGPVQLISQIPGLSGGGCVYNSSTPYFASAGTGGGTFFGPGGPPSSAYGTTTYAFGPSSSATGTASTTLPYGAGANGISFLSVDCGTGGGGGGYQEFLLWGSNLSGITYTVGTAQIPGASCTQNAANGIIIIEEYFD